LYTLSEPCKSFNCLLVSVFIFIEGKTPKYPSMAMACGLKSETSDINTRYLLWESEGIYTHGQVLRKLGYNEEESGE